MALFALVEAGIAPPAQAGIFQQVQHEQRSHDLADFLNRKNTLFAGSDDGGEHWAVIASLIETAKLSGIDPQTWLTDTLAKLAAGHRNDRLEALMPWDYSTGVV